MSLNTGALEAADHQPRRDVMTARIASRALIGTPQPDDGRRPTPALDELAALRRERIATSNCSARQKENGITCRARLRDALEQLEHWRTLAEYREAMRSRERESASGHRMSDRAPVERST